MDIADLRKRTKVLRSSFQNLSGGVGIPWHIAFRMQTLVGASEVLYADAAWEIDSRHRYSGKAIVFAGHRVTLAEFVSADTRFIDEAESQFSTSVRSLPRSGLRSVALVSNAPGAPGGSDDAWQRLGDPAAELPADCAVTVRYAGEVAIELPLSPRNGRRGSSVDKVLPLLLQDLDAGYDL